MNNVTTYHTFGSEAEAVEFRSKNGTGGWIFVPNEKPDQYMQCILFDPKFTPSQVLTHIFTAGRSGRLV